LTVPGDLTGILAGIMARPAGWQNVSEVSFWMGGRQGFSTLLALSMRQFFNKKGENQIKEAFFFKTLFVI
jgi:hypothetical protein